MIRNRTESPSEPSEGYERPDQGVKIDSRHSSASNSVPPGSTATIRAALFDTLDAKTRELYYRAPELLKTLSDEVERRDKLIVHMHVHSGYPKNGYLQMTTEQKALYDFIWGRSVAELDEEERR